MNAGVERIAATAAVFWEVDDGGTLHYIPSFLARAEADALFGRLLETVDWKQERGRFGWLYPRLTALYGDDGLIYTYSGVDYPCLLWTDDLAAVRRRVERAPHSTAFF
jgi:hypothetical protein